MKRVNMPVVFEEEYAPGGGGFARRVAFGKCRTTGPIWRLSDVAKTHRGNISQIDKKGRMTDPKSRSNCGEFGWAIDEPVITIVLKDKERLLSLTNHAFIFPIRLAREGWDNPNVLVIVHAQAKREPECQFYFPRRPRGWSWLRISVNRTVSA